MTAQAAPVITLITRNEVARKLWDAHALAQQWWEQSPSPEKRQVADQLKTLFEGVYLEEGSQ